MVKQREATFPFESKRFEKCVERILVGSPSCQSQDPMGVVPCLDAAVGSVDDTGE